MTFATRSSSSSSTSQLDAKQLTSRVARHQVSIHVRIRTISYEYLLCRLALYMHVLYLCTSASISVIDIFNFFLFIASLYYSAVKICLNNRSELIEIKQNDCGVLFHFSSVQVFRFVCCFNGCPI